MFAAGKTAGAAGAVAANYIEDVFSTYLYTGNGSTQTITNGITLSANGGLVWVKQRNSTGSHRLYDTSRDNVLSSNSTAAQSNVGSTYFAGVGSTSFTVGSNTDVNGSGSTYASWTFREQPKFFDVVTYTGTGANRTIAHNLGSVPGCIIVKRTDTTAAWAVYHRSLANTQYLVLNTTAAAATGATWWNSTTPTSSVFSVGTDATVNASGGTYVAYVYAHDAGGFGLTGTDNVISCGLFPGGTAGTVNLGYEPQWILFKDSAGTTSWVIYDVMRGWSVTSGNYLLPNTSGAEANTTSLYPVPNATGFSYPAGMVSGNTIYIAIRRGPMKVPTLGTTVFSPQIATGNGVSTTFTTNFPVDLSIDKTRTSGNPWWIDRLRGGTQYITSSDTVAEGTYATNLIEFTSNTGIVNKNYGSTSASYVEYMFRRAPGFFDEVCYTGNSTTRYISHNLSVSPELMIIKNRDGASTWYVYHIALGATQGIILATTAAAVAATYWASTTPTASNFRLSTSALVNSNTSTYVNYLFATCPGVSKVGSYTGTGALQTVACGFTTGARFVLIKRTDSTGDWYYWDSARGITSGNDPYLLMNSLTAEVTGTNYVDTDTTGFKVTAAAPAALNAVGGTYIFLAIA